MHEAVLHPPRPRVRAPEEDAVVSPAAREDSPIRAPRQAPNALEVEAPLPPWDNGGEPPQHGVDAHVMYVGGGKHCLVRGQGHELDQVEVPPPDHVCLVKENWWWMIIGGLLGSAGPQGIDADVAIVPPNVQGGVVP